MNKNLQKRLLKVEAHRTAMPIPHRVVRDAFERFQGTGVLPEDQRTALLVVQRAQAGYDWTHDEHGPFDMARAIRAAIEAKPRPEDKTMDELYMEAVLGDGIVRCCARIALQMLADVGLDPSKPLFAGLDVGLPTWGSVGIHLVGLPDLLVQPPYEAQAKRLFARFEVLRDRMPHSNRAWLDGAARAVADFLERGHLPEDALLRDFVLADAEVRQLMRHLGGDDVSEPMAVFDKLATSEGEARDAALQELLALAADGRLTGQAQDP